MFIFAFRLHPLTVSLIKCVSFVQKYIDSESDDTFENNDEIQTMPPSN